MSRFSIALILSFILLFPARSQQVKPFQKGDRVAFVGNSITDGGHYHSYIWLYYMTRFPEAKMEMFNCGIGGDCSWDMLKRLDQDVLSHKPNVMTLTFGMNDSGYYEYNGSNVDEFVKKRVAESTASFRKIEEKLQAHMEIRKVMIGGTPYDEMAKIKNQPFRRKNSTIQKFIALQQSTAQTNGWEFVDFNQPMLDLNRAQQQKDSSFTLCGDDRIHPDNDGHMVMAYLFLKSQGFSGKPVADMQIDALSGKVQKAENCKLSALKVQDGNLSFNYLANALPYPMDTLSRGWGARKSQAQANRYIPFIDEMNREMLKVDGLNGTYNLSIDGENIGDFTSAQLAQGINLAMMRMTPQYQQAQVIMHLNEERWEIERRFRQYAWMQFTFLQPKGLLNADNQAAIDTIHANMQKNIFLGGNLDPYSKAMHPAIRQAWNKEMAELVNTIYAVNKPRNRKFVLLKK